jgi:outer membrane protein insertion porin family
MKSFTRGARGLGSRFLTLLVFALLATTGPAQAQALRVADIQIRGNQRINEQVIRSVISTRVGDEFSPQRLARDQLDIEQLGWFRLVAPDVQRVNDEVIIVFVVREYPLVEEFTVSGSTLFTEADIMSRLQTRASRPGDPYVFNQVAWEADRIILERLYSDLGYFMAPFYNLDQPDFLERGILRVEIQEYRVGAVNIRWPLREIRDQDGNLLRTEPQHKTRNYVVMRELSQKPGALYNEEQLQRDYRALNALGFFEAINPSRDITPDYDVIITWELTERRTGQVSVGAGYSPRQQIIGRAEIADQNFLGQGRALSLSGEMGTWGGDGLPSFELQFYEPWLTPTRTSMTINLYNKLVWRFAQRIGGGDFADPGTRYFERRAGGQLSFGRPFQWPVTLGARFDDVTTSQFPGEFDLPRQDGQVVAANLSRIWNTRDYPQNPTSGSFARVSTELGHSSMRHVSPGGFAGGMFNRYIFDYRRYIALSAYESTREPEREQESHRKSVVAMRFMAGTVLGDVPFFEQFFLGGAETLRGYREDRFWGNHMFLGSVEYRRPVMNRIQGVLFADVGHAFGGRSEFRFREDIGGRFEQRGSPYPFGALGLGLRIQTPIGPVRLDVGYGLEGLRSHFNIGHAF